jgi:predicted NAD-dependent protein-ADP-ribosyltransferase YbiA (DUF1768 family)
MDIKLFNTNEKNFSKLSNDAYHPITIDGQKYPSVTNYIYSNMLTTPSFRQIIQNTEIKGAKQLDTELIGAIDFLLEKEEEKNNSSSSETVSLREMKQIIKKYKKDSEDDKNIRGFSKIRAEYEKIKAKHFPDDEKYQEKDRKEEKKEIERYITKISNEVRKPFESINLKQLKQQLTDESLINQLGIYKLYDSYVEKELYNTLRNATEKGYASRLKIPEIANILLSTGNFPIQYESSDPFLGVGSDGRGANIVGNTLMQLRHNLRIQKNTSYDLQKEKERDSYIYNVYLAYTALTKEMFTNKNTLNDYLGLNPKQIIKKYGAYKLVSGVLSQTDVINLYKKDKLNHIIMTEIRNPGSLVVNFRKNGMSQLRDILNNDKNDIIFNSYLEYMIKKNYNDEIQKQTKSKKKKDHLIQSIIATQKYTLSKSQLHDIKSRVVDLFKIGMLSASLSDKIDKDVELLNIPSEEDIQQAESEEIKEKPLENLEEDIDEVPENFDENPDLSSMSDSAPSDPLMKSLKRQFESENKPSKKPTKKSTSFKKTVTPIEGGLFIPPTGQPIIIYRNIDQNTNELKALVPEEYTGMLNIDYFYYPTIQHYIIARLIADTGVRRKADLYGDVRIVKGVGIIEGHRMIMVDPNLSGKIPQDYLTLQLAGETYDKFKKETDNFLFPLYTVTSLNSKFEDKDMQNLLLLTGDKEIKWNNPHNLYLGTGTKENPGQNYVGKTMMDIRERIKNSRKSNEIDINPSDLIEFIQKDSFIMQWIKMKLTDMCSIINKTQEYLKIKTDLDYNLQEDKEFKKLIKIVLNTIFHPCNYFTQSPSVLVPDFFVDMTKKCSIISSGMKPSKTKNNRGEYKWNKEIQKVIEEAEKNINKLESELYGSKIDHTVEESKQFEEYQRKEWNELWTQLNASGVSLKEKNKEADLFRKQQLKERNEFWGLNSDKSDDNVSNIEHKKKELKKELNDYLRKAESLDKHYNSVIKEISQILWDRIYNMLIVLVQNTKPSTSDNIKNFLVKVEDMISEKGKCIAIVNNEENNCIVSSVLNLLSSISSITQNIVPTLDVKLDENSVKLAGSIIMNTSFIGSQNQSEIDQSTLEEKELEQIDENEFEIEEEGLFPQDDEEENKEWDYDENPYFEFKKRKSGKENTDQDLDNIKQQVTLITQENTNAISKYVMKMVETIKNHKMSKKIKQNRINYFATMM